MSENQFEQPATPVGSVHYLTLIGHVQHLQVEDDPDGPVMVCGVKVKSSDTLDYFFLRLRNNQPIFEAQLNLLRDAIILDTQVRVKYDPTNKLGPNASRIVAVRLQLDP